MGLRELFSVEELEKKTLAVKSTCTSKDCLFFTYTYCHKAHEDERETASTDEDTKFFIYFLSIAKLTNGKLRNIEEYLNSGPKLN